MQPVETPSVAQYSRFSLSGNVPLDQQWWRSFDDPELNQLVDQSFADNLSLAQAWSRLAQSEATLFASSAASYPSLSLATSARRQWQNTPGGATSTDATSGSSAFNSSYELDLWGKIKAQYEGAYFDYLASEQDLQTAATSLAAQTANTWFALIEKTAQGTLLQTQYQTAQQTLESIQIRFMNGNRNGTDLLQQQQVIESRKALLILNQSDIAVLEHSLAILLGKDPSLATFSPPAHLSELPPFPSIGLPASVLTNRPDIKSAWLAIQSADADVAASIANRFPAITIGGSISAAFGSPINLFENWIKSLSASLSLPLIDGGSRRAEVERRQALARSAVLQYQSIFLAAIKEVEDAIVQEQKQRDYLESLNKQVDLAERVFEQTLNRYQKGNQTYIQVLTTQDSLHTLLRTRLTAQRTLLTYRVALYRAIGGGFELQESRAWANTAPQGQ